MEIGFTDEMRRRARAHFPKDGMKVYVRTTPLVACPCGAEEGVEPSKTQCGRCGTKFPPDVLRAIAQVDGLDCVRVISGCGGPTFLANQRWRESSKESKE